jgi:hypothetical protein
MTAEIRQIASRMAGAIYLIAAGFIMSWPVIAIVELIRLSR